MYSRSYYPGEENRQIIPEGYDGTAFQEVAQADVADEPHQDKTEVEQASSTPLLSGLFGNISLPFLDGIRMPKIGTEELLILAVAGFLLFSKNGDRECALILLFLLFIN